MPYQITEHEYTLDGGVTIQPCTSSMANGDGTATIPVGNVAKAIGQVGVRVKAAAGRNPSPWLFNQQVFTATAEHPVESLSPYAWYEARAINTSDTNQVRSASPNFFLKQYNDLSSNVRHLVQATDANQPQVLASGLSFGASASPRVLTGPAITDLLAGSFELGLYLDIAEASTLQMLFEAGNPTNGAGFNVYLQTANILVRYKQTASATEVKPQFSCPVGEKQVIFISVRQGQDIRIFSKTNLLATSTSLGATVPEITAPINYMNRAGSSINFRGTTRAMLLLPRVITPAERLDLVNYLTF